MSFANNPKVVQFTYFCFSIDKHSLFINRKCGFLRSSCSNLTLWPLWSQSEETGYTVYVWLYFIALLQSPGQCKPCCALTFRVQTHIKRQRETVSWQLRSCGWFNRTSVWLVALVLMFSQQHGACFMTAPRSTMIVITTRCCVSSWPGIHIWTQMSGPWGI